MIVNNNTQNHQDIVIILQKFEPLTSIKHM